MVKAVYLSNETGSTSIALIYCIRSRDYHKVVDTDLGLGTVPLTHRGPTEKQIRKRMESNKVFAPHASFSNWLSSLHVSDEVSEAIGKAHDLRLMLNLVDIDRALLLFCMDPEPDGDGIAYYRNGQDRAKGRKVTTKLGKFVRHLILDKDMSDMWVEARVNVLKDRLFPRKFTLKSGTSREDFRHAYAHTQAPYRDPRTTAWRKSLANSCMRFDCWDIHPAEYYASGDFTIVWLEDDVGRIAGRVVVCNGEAAPCYGVCDQSLNILDEYLDSQSIGYGQSKWFGARLLKLPCTDGVVYAAYLDDYEYVRDDGEYLIVDNSGRISAKEHEGYFYLDGGPSGCCECGDPVSRSDVYTNQSGDGFCECCYNGLYTWDEIDDVEILRDESVSVTLIHNSWYGITHHDNAVKDEVEGEFILTRESVTCGDGRVTREDRVFISDLTEEYWPLGEMCKTIDGENAHESELLEEGYVLNDDGLYELKGEEECKEEAA